MYFCSLALSRLHKIICLVLFFILIQHNCTSAQTTVDARLDSINMFIGHQVHLYLSVDCDKTSKVSFPVFKNREFITDGVEVLETSEDKESPLDNDRKRIDKVYTLTSFEDSLYVIPALKITVDGNEYYSKRLALKVMTLNTDSIDVDKFFPPKDVQKNPFSLKEWLLVILLIMLFCISLFILVRNAKRLKRKEVEKSPSPQIIKSQSYFQKSLSEIERLKNDYRKDIISAKDYYVVLTDIIRQYIKERFSIDAFEMTSDDIVDALSTKDIRDFEELQVLFTTSDLAKFADYVPSSLETKRDMQAIEDFVRHNKKEEEIIQNNDKVKTETTKRRSLDLKSLIVLVTLCVITTSLLLFIIYRIVSIIE